MPVFSISATAARKNSIYGKCGLDAAQSGQAGGDHLPGRGSKRLKEEVRHILQIQLEDNVKAHILQPDGSYEKIDKRGKTLVCAQEYFCEGGSAPCKDREREASGAGIYSDGSGGSIRKKSAGPKT